MWIKTWNAIHFGLTYRKYLQLNASKCLLIDLKQVQLMIFSPIHTKVNWKNTKFSSFKNKRLNCRGIGKCYSWKWKLFSFFYSMIETFRQKSHWATTCIRLCNYSVIQATWHKLGLCSTIEKIEKSTSKKWINQKWIFKFTFL